MGKEKPTKFNTNCVGKGYILSSLEMRKLRHNGKKFYLFADVGKCVFDGWDEKFEKENSDCYVYDHHTLNKEDTKKFPSATDMIVKNADSLYEKIDQYDDCEIITHRPPDVDSVCTIAVTKFIYNTFKEIDKEKNPDVRERKEIAAREVLDQIASIANASDSFTFNIKKKRDIIAESSKFTIISTASDILDEYISGMSKHITPTDNHVADECVKNCVDAVNMLMGITYREKLKNPEEDIDVNIVMKKLMDNCGNPYNYAIPKKYNDAYYSEIIRKFVRSDKTFKKTFNFTNNEAKEIKKNVITKKELKSGSYKLDPAKKQYSSYDFKTPLYDDNDKKTKRGFYGTLYTGERDIGAMTQKDIIDSSADLLIVTKDIEKNGVSSRSIKISSKQDYNMNDFGAFIEAKMRRKKFGIDKLNELLESGGSDEKIEKAINKMKYEAKKLERLYMPTENGNVFDGFICRKFNYVAYKCNTDSELSDPLKVIDMLKEYMKNPIEINEKEYLDIMTGRGTEAGMIALKCIDKEQRTKLYDNYLMDLEKEKAKDIDETADEIKDDNTADMYAEENIQEW